MSQTKLDNQYADGFTPATVCRCFALEFLSCTMKVPNVPAINGKLSIRENLQIKKVSKHVVGDVAIINGHFEFITHTKLERNFLPAQVYFQSL